MRLRIPCLAVSLLLITSCGGGGGGGGGSSEPAFVVPPRPASFASESGLNQPPPQDWLAEVVVPRPMRRPSPLAREDRDEAEAEALALALSHMTASGFGLDDATAVTHVLPDEYGGIHVKQAQTYQGLPVLGAGLACHLAPDLAPDVSDNLVRGIVVDTTPRVTEPDTIADALSRYGSTRGGVTPVATARLAILPKLARVRARTDYPTDNTDDFDVVLEEALLVWEVIVGPQIPDVDAVLQSRLSGAPPGTDSDDASTDLARRENATRAGNDFEAPSFEAMTTAIVAPGIRYRFDALTGDLLDETVLSAQDDFQAEVGVGHSWFHGEVPLSVARWPANETFYLLDVVRPDTGNGFIKKGNYVLDAHNLPTHDVAEMDFINDWNNVWGDGSVDGSVSAGANSARRQTPAVDVAYGVQMTWDFQGNVLSRWGPAGDGTPTRACVHYDAAYTDAHYNDTSGFICFGDGDTGTGPGNYGLETVAHELGHAFWHAVGNGTDTAEARALNEGHGDIQGGLVNCYRNTGLGVGTQVRRFPNFADWRSRVVNPDGYTEKDADGDTHIGQKYWSADLTDMPEHVGGLPFGRAFIYLAEGAPSDPDSTLYTTEFPDGLGGIGIGKAAHIWHAAVAYYVVGTPDYATMRSAFMAAASYLYGFDSMERKAVRRAFRAIRVGGNSLDSQAPGIAYAQVFAVDPKDMTALVFAVPTDDTGFRAVKVDGFFNRGVYPIGFPLGYASIARAPLGTSEFAFTVEDSDGKTTSVNRSFLKVRNRNLLVNGDFEDDMTGWTTFSGDDRTFVGSSRAFLGVGFLIMEGLDSAWQQVTVPAGAKNVALVFRVLVRNSAKAGEYLAAQVQNAGGGTLEVLATYDHDTPADTRNWLNKGYLRQEFDLTAYAGQTIRIAFVNLTAFDKYRFAVDQVMLSYEETVTVGLPEVKLNEWENVVSFTLPEISGLETGEISRVDWYIDNVFVGAGPISATDYFGAYFLGNLTPGAHWVAGRIRGLDNAILKDTQAVWFEPGPFHEVLANGGFEAGAWDLTYSDPPPKVLSVQNAPNVTIAFDGQKALRLGGQADGSTTEAGQAVQMPQQMVTLDFSIRVKVVTTEDPMTVEDELKLEIWNLATFQKLAEYPVATENDRYYWPGIQEGWREYLRMNVSIPPGLVNGKNILVRLKTHEDAESPTWFFVDNASLRYTQWGVQAGG